MYEFREEDAYEFARVVGIQAKKNGDNLQFIRCPYCNGGQGGRDRGTFAISLRTGAFNCLRNSCGVKGNMVTLHKDFPQFSLGDMVDEYYKPKKKYVRFQQPKDIIVPKDKAIQYLESRGISEQVAKDYQITVRNDNENVLVMPHFDENEVLVYIKYRNIDFVKGETNGAKEYCEKGGKPILYGMWNCNGEFDRLIVTEGHMDCLSVATAGYENVVSVPNGCKAFTFFPYCWNWLSQYKEIVIFGDYERGHISLLDEFARRFGSKVKHIREKDYKDCKDANELLLKYGKEHIKKCIENAVYIPVNRVVDISDVKAINLDDVEFLKTGLRDLDDLLEGGLPFGYLTLLTGVRGEGKLLANETPVFTKNGWKQHGDLVVGDEVLGRHGEFVKVTHVFPKGIANMKVTLNNNEVIYCHENHEWVTNFEYGGIKKEKVMETKEIFKKIQNGYTHTLRLISKEPMIGCDVDLKVNPYMLGVWLGDGRTTNPDICYPNKDACIIDSIVNDCGYEISWHTVHKTTGVRYVGLKELRTQLNEYGMCHSRNPIEKYIPHDYLIAKEEQRLELLAGLLDTDGYLDENGRYTFSTTSEKLRDGVLDLVRSFGWNCGLNSQQPRLSTSGIQGRKVIWHIKFRPIGKKIPCRVERKQVKEVCNKLTRINAIRSIEYCEPREGNCIEVEGGVYLAGKTMTPTHNSTLGNQIITKALEQDYMAFVYSGELTQGNCKEWIDRQIAGSDVSEEYTASGYCRYKIRNSIQEELNEWYRGKCYIYDNTMVDDEEEDLLKTIEEVICKYGVRVVLVDNLMTAMDSFNTKDDKWEKQSKFVKAAAKIAQRYNIVFILVAHKRKSNGLITDENDDVSGSADITNLAGIVVSYGVNKSEETARDYPRLLKVSKNRLTGKTNLTGFLTKYDERSKRIFGDRDDKNHDYGYKRTDDGFFEQEDTPFY